MEKSTLNQPRGSIKQKFAVFSIVLFLAIFVAGSIAFFFSMRQIVHKNKRSELAQMADIQRIGLEASVNSEIAIALTMADSPLVKRHFLNPKDNDLRRIAFDEIEGYRQAFKSKQVFWASDINKEFYFSENNHYTINPEDPGSYWYNDTLHVTGFNFNINYNPELGKTMLWINAPVYTSGRRPIGLVGTGIDLTEFVDSIYLNFKGTGSLYFFNTSGEITGASDPKLIADKVNLANKLSDTGSEILSWVKTKGKDTAMNFNGDEGEIAVCQIPALDWYVAVIQPLGFADYIGTGMTGLFLAMMALIALIFIIFNISIRTFLRPLKMMVAALAKISSDWDLTKRIEIYQNDEVGTLAEFFNQTFERMRELLLSIRKDGDSLSKTGSDLSANMIETSAAINQITANIQSMKNQALTQAGEVNSAGMTMERIMHGLDTLNDHIAEQVDRVSQSSSAIEEMLANIRAVTETLVRNSANITSLGESSKTGREDLRNVSEDIQEISRESEGLLEINSVMENIASQTNLLSMNAAIEAAHAGEAGKGFAVVADEIRKLAENSGQQSKIISETLKKIKASIDSITKSTKVVLDRFEIMAKDVETVSDQESQIRNSMEEQETGSRQILEAIGRLNSITSLVKNTSEKMAEESDKVMSQSDSLKRITEEVSGGMDEMAIGAEQINTAVNMINEISLANKNNIGDLSRGIAKFRLE